jgi:hypothetical protein
MQSVEVFNIPEFFKNGYLFQELSFEERNHIEGDENHLTLSFPIQCCHFDISSFVEVHDVCALLSTLRYWGVRKIPVKLLAYLLETPMSSETITLLAGEHREGDSFAFLADLSSFKNNTDMNQRLEYAAGNGYVHLMAALLQYVAARNQMLSWSNSTCTAAAKGGHLECLQFAYKHGFHWNMLTCSAAAIGGHLGCLQYAHEHGCPWDAITTYSAAKGGHLDCLRYAHERGCLWNKYTCSGAADCGSLPCLKFAFEHGCVLYKEDCIGSVKRSSAASEEERNQCIHYLELLPLPKNAMVVLVENKGMQLVPVPV